MGDRTRGLKREPGSMLGKNLKSELEGWAFFLSHEAGLKILC